MVLSKYHQIKYCQYGVFNCDFAQGFPADKETQLSTPWSVACHREHKTKRRVAIYEIFELFGDF